MSEAHQKRLADPDVRRKMEENLELGREASKTPEARARAAERLRVIRTGAVASPETRLKLRLANLGKVTPAETRAKQAEAMRAAHASGRHSGPDLEAVRRMGLANLGRKATPEQLKRMSVAQQKRWDAVGNRHSEETLEKMRVARSKQKRVFRSSLEVTVAEMLDAEGISYERNRVVEGLGKHQWDFILREANVLLEVDGCYWHGCPDCGYPDRYGRAMMDEAQSKAAEDAGWEVVRLKECELHALEAVA